MTHRERVLTALRREIPDRAPYEVSWGAFAPLLMETYRKETGSDQSPEEYFDFDTRSVVPLPTRKMTDFTRYYPDGLPDNVSLNEWGVGTVPSTVAHFVEYKYHPLAEVRTAEEVGRFAWPDLDAAYRYEGLTQRIAAFQERGYAVTAEITQTIFENGWMLRGLETLLMDFYLNEDIAHAICERLTELRIAQAQIFAQAGADILRLGDDVATQTGPMMSVAIYRKFLKERNRRIIRAARAIKPDILVFMHCDGKVDELVEEFIDIGVDILNPVQPECNDLAMLADRFGGRIAFWGGIGTQSTMPFGTPEDVAREVRHVRETLGRDGGLLLAPSHLLEPEVPWENVLAFFEAARNARY